MLIAGGVYVERCIAPDILQLLGSAGRAALALAAFRQDIDLHCYHPESLWPDLDANFAPWGIRCHPYPSAERVSFSYLFPLDRPFMQPYPSTRAQDIVVEGAEILMFGCVEGQFISRGGSVVFDPQGSIGSFDATGGRAERLALIVNAEEARAISQRSELSDAAADLLRADQASVLVIKDGPRGALVFESSGEVSQIPPYRSASLYKIGSGGIFSAVFAHHWFSGSQAADAADQASRQTSVYVEAPVLPLRCKNPARVPIQINMPQRVRLVPVKQSTSSAWFVAIASQALERLGVEQIDALTVSELLAEDHHHAREDPTILFVPDGPTAKIMSDRLGSVGGRTIINVDDAMRSGEEWHDGQIFHDLSQAIYEICWAAG